MVQITHNLNGPRVCKCKKHAGHQTKCVKFNMRVKQNAIYIYTHSTYLSQNDPRAPYDQWCQTTHVETFLVHPCHPAL